MGKGGGRPRDDEVWQHVTVLEGGRRVKCNHCDYEFAASANRIKSHIHKDKGKGIRVCPRFAQSNNFGSHKGNSNDLQDKLLHSRGQIQADDAKYLESIQVGSSSVSNRENEDLQVIQYVFDCLSPGDTVFISPLSYLTQEDFITLIKPETNLDSLVIDVFVEILTDIEQKKKARPSNWYLPVTFSSAALNSKKGHFLNFVHRQKMRENYMYDMKSCEKIFIPVHIEAKSNGGHFYLYIIHLKNKEIEIWDSLSNTFVAETDRDETTKKLLLAMEKLFKEVPFTKFRSKMANNILSQPNGFDCGIFVINFMKESDNYVKRSPLLQFDSNKEREDLALKLLKSDLNQEKQNLYDKARWHYAQVGKQDGYKRLRVDTSKACFEDVGSEQKAEHDDFDERVRRHDGLEKGSPKGYTLPTTDLIGKKFQKYTQQIWKWVMDDKVSAIGIWGIGGSGKTVLATHIHNKLLKEASSDIKVIWVTVSQNSISQLQKVIARSIDLDICNEFEVRRITGKLLQIFKEIKKCVVILDDVWDHFFLKEIGFLMSDNRIKLMLTTRLWEVCQGMDCEKNTIKIKPLDKEDSWALFKKIMGFHEGLSSEVEDTARHIACECDGLPLAIVRIATSMKGKKQAREWSHMLECLENLGNGQYEMNKWVLPVLRSSYDFLNNKLQRFFLYCVLNTDGDFYDDDANHLIRRFVYESIDESKKLRVQDNEGYNMLYILMNHSMLERHDDKWSIHKFLRVLAIGIAEDSGEIMANAYKNLSEIPSDDKWKEDLQKVFLTKNKIQTIPDGTCPRCSQLSTLLLDRNANLNFISDEFFNNMPTLKTLDLSYTDIKRLPESVSNLKCLTALLLSACGELRYIPSLRKLKWLMSLDLSFTAITEAPVGLESLVNLRCLNLLGTDELVMSISLISKLINLEILQLSCTLYLMADATAQDIQGLEKLEVIAAYFRDDISSFNIFVSFLKKCRELRSYDLNLQRARHFVFYDKEINKEYSMKRIIFWGMDLGNIRAVLPRDSKEVFIKDCHQGTGARSLCSFLSYVHQIERLDIYCCQEVEYLCCFSGSCPFCSFSQLVGCLSLSDMRDLKHLVSPYAHSLHHSTLFSHITDLHISTCIKMETLMTPKLSVHLQDLRTIYVCSCWVMKEIVGENHSEMELIGSGDLSHLTITFPKLTSLKLEYMFQLNFVYKGIMLCPSLQTFSAVCCEQLNHPQIEISNGFELPMEKTSAGYHWQIETV